MKSVQFIKQVNNTELGKAGTNETYVLVPQEVDVSDIFEEVNFSYRLKNKKSDNEYTVRLTIGGEKRIVGLGPFYRDNNLCAGDKIIFEKLDVDNESTKYYIDFKKSNSAVYFQKTKGAFEPLNQNEAFQLLIGEEIDFEGKMLKVAFNSEIKKRKDSPTKTKIYDISINDYNINGNYKKGEVIEIRVKNQKANIFKCALWEKHIIEVNA